MSVNLSSDDPLCIESKEVNTNVWLIVLFCLTLLFDLVAIVFCVIGAKSVYRTQLIHVNLRISLFSVAVALLVRAAFTAFRCIRYLVRAVIFTNTCDFLDTTDACNTIAGLHSWGYIVVAYTIPLITVERLIALIASSRYESLTYPKVVTFINLLLWVYGGVCFYFKMEETIANRSVVYCSSFTQSYFQATIIDLINREFLVPFICLCIDIALHFYCKYHVKKLFRNEFHEHSLSHRFQLNEILRTAQIAIPASSLFCYLNTQSNLIVFIPVSMGFVSTTQQFSLWKEFSAVTTMPIYTTVYGILLYWYNVRPINAVLRCCQRKQVTPSTSGSSQERVMKETDLYFQIYSARW